MSNWLTYSPTSGHGNGQIIITADALSSLDSRIDTIVAVNNDYSLTATTEIEQIPFNPTSLTEYLTFEIISGGTIYWKSGNDSFSRTIYYSKDSGTTWSAITSTTGGTEISAVNGDTVIFKGDNSTYNEVNSFFTNRTSFTFSDGMRLNLRGNIMSLINSVNFSNLDTLVADHTFFGLFGGNAAILNARELQLPAIVLSMQCYGGMFAGCSALTAAPELPATVLSVGCYMNMFFGCSALTTAPSILPALSISQKDACYANMFTGCASLRIAPELPATTLGKECYAYMFEDCTNLQYVKCLATDKSATDCTSGWMLNVPVGQGTFVKHQNATWGRGYNAIPGGWTVVDAT